MIRHDGFAAAGHAGHDSLVIKDVSVSKDVYVNKDVITPFEPKTLDLIPDESNKVSNL